MNGSIMKQIVNKNYMYNLELQSLHYWFKNGLSQNPSNRYNNVLKIMQNTVYKNDISDVMSTNIEDCTNVTRRLHANYHDREIVRNVFEHWKIYVIHKLHTRRAIYKANYFYKKKLQKLIINALSRNVLLKWQNIVSSMNKSSNKVVSSINDIKAEKYTKTLLKKYFSLWVNYISLKNKRKILLEQATGFYNAYCLKKCIVNWKMYITQQRQKKAIQDKATNFYIQSILKKYVTTWVNICEFTLLKDKVNYAIKYYNNKLLLKYFHSWKIYHEIKLQKLNIEKYIQAYHRKKLLKQYFKWFTMYVSESIADKVAQENAKTFYNLKLMKKVFTAWECWYNKKVENFIRICQIKSIIEEKRKRTILIDWRAYVLRQKCKRRKICMSQNFYLKNLAIKALRKLHNYAIYRKEKRNKLFYLSNKSDKIIEKLQYICIEKWRKALYSAVQEKQKFCQAIKFWELNLIHKHFLYWKQHSQQYKVKMFRKENLHSVAISFLLKRFILQWHTRLNGILDMRKKEAIIMSAIKVKIMRGCILSWKEHVARKMKIRNHIEKAKELHKKFLLCEGLKAILRNSLRNIDKQYDMQLENVIIRSFTNFEIVKEYFDKWYYLTYSKSKSKFLSNVMISDTSECLQSQTYSNNVFNNVKNNCLILPEYMEKKVVVTHTN